MSEQFNPNGNGQYTAPTQQPQYQQAQYQQPQYPPQYQQPQYQQPQYQQPYIDPTREVMSIGEYLGMFVLSSIPVVGFICWIVWLASSNTNKNKKNYIIATIIYSLIISVISGIVIGILAATGVLAGSQLINY